MTRHPPGYTGPTSRRTIGGTTLVVGLGSPDRGDDAVGSAVASAVAALGMPDVEVVVHEDPTDLIELWSGFDRVVIVDAVRSGATPGTLRTLETAQGRAPLPQSAWSRTGRGGTHAFGVAAAIELGRALRRLPRRLTLVGVEARAFEHGTPLSPEVAAAIPGAVSAVLTLVGTGTVGTPAPSRGRAHVPG